MGVMWSFAKAHGTGNDFVVLPDPEGDLPLTAVLATAICDRRRGIGADGILRVIRSSAHPEGAAMAADAEWFMDYWNADGSLAEFCGNGVRAYARFLTEEKLAGPGPLRIATRAGVVDVAVDDPLITVSLARPVIGKSSTATVSGRTLAGIAVTAGNPNLVCPIARDELAVLDLNQPPALPPNDFPRYANVEFISGGDPVEGTDAHIQVRVFERGVGETLSCGSGACAAAAVALREAGRDDGTVAVDVPGGRLVVDLNGELCKLSGPAVVVARGELNPDALAH
jgi:diaminopimelate epimerase